MSGSGIIYHIPNHIDSFMTYDDAQPTTMLWKIFWGLAQGPPDPRWPHCVVGSAEGFFTPLNLTSVLCLPSVLWRCWLGGMEVIRPVKTERWGAGMVTYLRQGAEMHTSWPGWRHYYSLSLAPVNPDWFLPFWYQLTRVVPDKGPLNGCSSSQHWGVSSEIQNTTEV